MKEFTHLEQQTQQKETQNRRAGTRNYRLYKIRTAPLSERCSTENHYSKIIAGVLKKEKH